MQVVVCKPLIGFLTKLIGLVKEISKLSSGMCSLLCAPARSAGAQSFLLVKEIQATLMWEGILNTQTERAGLDI